jgi:2,3-bisphosphoglycerate-independent phosphoglycerate mutase
MESMSIKYSGPVVLIVMDGYGLSDNPNGNAIMAANKPTLDRISRDYPMQKLKASGTAVGLPTDDDIGNSEVGHNAMGAGRIYAQGARLINDAIESGAMYRGIRWRELIDAVKDNGTTLHFIGLLSDGNVHSHISHLFAMLDEAAREGVQKVRIHILLDGRDVDPTSALHYVDDLEWKLGELNAAGRDYRIADGGGRMQITMDRYEANWPMVEKGWHTHVQGEGREFASAREAIETYRREIPGVIDQDIPPFVIADNGSPIGIIEDGDSVILFNFRGDRSQELALAFEGDESFDKFDRGRVPNIHFASLLEYDSEKHIPKHFLVAPPEFEHTLGEVVAENGLHQLAISETQKIGHVTYFFNGNRAAKFNEELEDYVEIPSDRVPFDTEPAMKSAEIAEKLVGLLYEQKYQFVRVNFPNPDMVGHTGNYDATVQAVEAVDAALAEILPAIDEVGGMAIITGDHGNAEEEYELNDDGSIKMQNGRPIAKTAHTTNRVPCIFYDNTENTEYYTVKPGDEFGLANLASTIANLLDIEPRPEWLPSIIEYKYE